MTNSRKQIILLYLAASAGLLSQAVADERRFTYSYEPEVLPQRAMEFEQWVTWSGGRSKAVGQDNYRLWEFREELEYGVTDNYSISLYLNGQNESYRVPDNGNGFSKFTFTGVSLENRYMVLDPVEHTVGLTLYLEPRFSGTEAELEEKVILGQRYGDWKWALNITHATEWSDHFHSTEGEFEVSMGLSRDLGKHWSVGLELRDHNELPDYNAWENTALYLGPVLGYRHEKWWTALTVMPQIYGANFHGNPGGNSWLELEGHERINIRWLTGISF